MKHYHLLSLVLVAALVSILTACSGATVTKTVTLPATTVTQSAPMKTIVQTQTITVTLSAESTIPSQFSTFTSEGLFSISYPPDWEPVQSVVEELETWAKELLLDIDAGLPVDQVTAIFIAGLPYFSGWSPNINITIQSLTGQTINLDMMVDAAVEGVRVYIDDFKEYSRINTTVDGRDAIIIEWEGTIPTLPKTRVLQMHTIIDKIDWIVTCTPPSGEFGEWEEVFYNILNSFRYLKS